MKQNDEVIARRVLATLAEIKDLFRNHSIEIRRMNGVRGTLHAVEVIKYETGPVLEGYMDAELADGTILSWLLDVRWTEDSWTIEAKMARSAKGEQDVLESLPISNARTLDEFIRILVDTAHRLLGLRPALLFGPLVNR
jgi:hypothetical protein